MGPSRGEAPRRKDMDERHGRQCLAESCIILLSSSAALCQLCITPIHAASTALSQILTQATLQIIHATHKPKTFAETAPVTEIVPRTAELQKAYLSGKRYVRCRSDHGSMDHTDEPRLVFASELVSWHLSRMPLARVSWPCSCV
jgi:hypothetical protein